MVELGLQAKSTAFQNPATLQLGLGAHDGKLLLLLARASRRALGFGPVLGLVDVRCEMCDV